MAVSAMECSLAKSSAPPSVRKHLLTLCFIFIFLTPRSLAWSPPRCYQHRDPSLVIGYKWVGEESEQIVFYFKETLPETFKFFIEVCEAFSQEVIHLGLQHLYLSLRDIAVSPETDGVSYQVDDLRDQFCSVSSSLRYFAFLSR